MNTSHLNKEINLEILSLIPKDSKKIINSNCMLGQLAFFYKEINPDANFIGIEKNSEFAQIATNFCDEVFIEDIENLTDHQLDYFSNADCWILENCLENLKNPELTLSKIKNLIRSDGCALVCTLNFQHWSYYYRLLSGQLWHKDGAPPPLHQFTRKDILEIFENTGWDVKVTVYQTQKETLQQVTALQSIRISSAIFGLDPAQSERDAIPTKYIFKLTPKS